MEGGRIIHEKMPWMWYSYEQVTIHNDTAYLRAKKHAVNIRYKEKEYQPSVACGLLRSEDTFGYGRFSTEIQLPKGKNLWPAFWLVGEGRWPDNGEIDVCEAWTPYFRLLNWRTTHNIHWYDGGHIDIGSKPTPLFKSPCPTNNFVRYEVEWRPDIITFFVDGKQTRCYGNDVARHLQGKKMHAIFDCWTTQAQFSCESPMKIRSFEYKPLEML